MKPLHAVLLVLGFASLQAAEGLPDAGPHHQRIQRVQAVTRTDGTSAWITNSYVHLEPGLNRGSREGWVAADERLEVVGDSVVAQGTQHRAIWTASVLGGVDVEMPSGDRLNAFCLGLSFYDAASGQSVLIAEAQDVVAEVHPPNILVYRGALAGDRVEADLVFVNHRDRVEQLIVIQALGVLPEDYQLVSASTRLEVVSEFVDPPAPRKHAQVLRREEDPIRRRAMVEPDLIDESLDFGSMHMPAGQAFVPAGDLRQMEAAGGIPVCKRWQVTPGDGRTALFESVEFESLRPLLSALKPTAGRPLAQAAPRRQPTLTRSLPPRRVASNASKPVQMAKAGGLPRGVTVDWALVSSGTITNAVFTPGTYYVAGQVTLAGTNATFDGSAILKFSPTNTARLNLACNDVTWLGSAGRPVVLTGRDDNSIGQSITNGTLSGTYATIALNIQSPLTGVNLSHLRVVNAQTAVAFSQGANHTVSHAQFVNCGTPIKLTSAEVRVRNALMVNATTCFDFTSSTARVEHLTVNGATTLNNAGVLILSNSLIVAVGATNGWSGVSNVFVASANGVFATAAAGSHYLASGSAYRDAGTPDISTNLQQDFKGMTTVAPTFLTDTITTATTLGPQVERDTARPDLGWHYVALDYMATLLTVTNTTLTLTNGVAIGFHGSIWVWPLDASLISEGTPDRLNRLAALTSVQEQPLTNYAVIAASAAIYASGNTNSTATLRFTSIDGADYSLYGVPGGRLAAIDVRHCAFGPGTLNLELEATNTAVTLVNNLFDRHAVTIMGLGTISAFNNLSRYADFFLLNDGANSWVAKDNAFEGGTPGSTGPVGNGYNAYINGASQLSGGTNDVVLSSFTYATDKLGRFYQVSTGLLNAGSRTVAEAGLYHFTVLTSQTKDTNAVDIGLHYVAVDGGWNPLDAGDGDGIPDYREDRTGGGTADSGETDWQSATDQGLRVKITRPTESGPVP